VWHPDRFPNDPRLQEKAQEKLKEINLAYDYLKSHRYTPPPKDEEYQEEEEPAPEEKTEPEEPQTTYTTTYKPPSFFSRIPKWFMIVIAIVLIRALSSYLNAPSKPQKTHYNPSIYYPLPSTPVPPAIEPPSTTEKPKLQRPVTKPLTKPPPQTSKVIPQPAQDEALKETEDTSQISEEDLSKKSLSQLPDKVATLSSPQRSVSRNYFTIGSSKDEVLAVQGTPNSIIGDTWHYGYSSVEFLNGMVEGYSNISKNLHVKLSPKADSSLEHRRDYFTIGSSQEEVLAVQGTPSSIIGTTWHYAYSSVEFLNGRVKGYSNISHNLRVKLLPKAETLLQSPGYFTIGSTQDEVLAVQGTPTSIIGNTWHYGYSSVDFLNGKVGGYSDISKNLKVRLQ
jgi:curved DNA-binding protein CbpA